MSDHNQRLGVICGSGIDTAALEDGSLAADSRDVIVIDRHGTDHTPAHLVDHVHNLTSLAEAGCDRVLALNSVGSLRLDWPVGTVVAPDDFYAPAVNPSIYDDARGHRVPGLDPGWRAEVAFAWRSVSEEPIHEGGVYAQTRGPRFETPAEIRVLAQAADLVGMTMAAECIIAGELDLAYASVCVVDNMANGLDLAPLDLDRYQEGVRANRAMLIDTIPKLVRTLVELARTPGAGEA